MQFVKEYIAHTLPTLGAYKRFLVAAHDRVRPRGSYAQHGEDLRILELLDPFDLSEGYYVDVGANHPTTISNTYLLYRRGARGIVVEPNLELVRLFALFRPRDVVLPIACAEEAAVATFTVSKTPVLSSLDARNVSDAWRSLSVPVLPLDIVIRDVAPLWIPFLSVDVEGNAGAVLRGARKTLERTYLACIEASANTDEEAEVMAELAAAKFSVVERIGCNLLALNARRDSFERFRVAHSPGTLPIRVSGSASAQQ